MVRIALYNSFHFHYEMFGFALDYCVSRGIVPVLHTNTEGSCGWFEEYSRRLGTALDIRSVDSYRPSDYDYVFLLTDDDPQYSLRLSFQPGARILVFEHFALRNVMRRVHQCIPLRKYCMRLPPTDDAAWMLPVWRAVAAPAPAPMTSVALDAPIHVVCIGNNCPSTPAELAPWFYSLRKSIRFTFINRSPAPTRIVPEDWSDYPNISILLNIDTPTMLGHIERADWLLLLPKNGNQFQNAISCLIPLSYSFQVPLLLPESWREAYGLRGLKALDPSVPLCRPTAAELADLAMERDALLARRDAILDRALAS